jgi:hypothetical protein
MLKLSTAAAGVLLGLAATAPTAVADPTDPVAPLPPAPAIQSAGTDAAPPDVVVPPNGMPHLASPEAPPPGSTMEPQDDDSPNVSYLKDLWQAVQNHDISGKQALLMGIAQRGMNTPYPDQAPGPNVPTSPGDAAAAAPPPAPQDVTPPPTNPLPPANPLPPNPTP